MEETNPNMGQTPQEPKKEVNTMALISYIGPLCLIPFINKTQDEFVRFHMKQGLVLLILELTSWIIFGIVPVLWAIANLFGIIWLVLSIIGIMNVVKNEKKEIPFIGKYADKIKI
jgi:fumarate reductase subunit D